MSKKASPHTQEAIKRVVAAKGITKTEEQVASLATHIFAIGEAGRGVIDFRAFDFDVEGDEEACTLAEKLRALRLDVHHVREQLKFLDAALSEFTDALIDTGQAEFLVRHMETLRAEAQIWGGSDLGRFLRECMSDVALVVEAAEQPA